MKRFPKAAHREGLERVDTGPSTSRTRSSQADEYRLPLPSGGQPMRVELGGHCVAEIRVLLRLAEASGSWREPAKGHGIARGRSRTDTLLRAADFHPTSTFVAPAELGRVRGLEHAFTIALRP